MGGQTTFDKAMEGIHRLQAHPNSNSLFTGVLSVIDPRTDPEIVYRFFKDLGVPSMDFLYQDGNHDRMPFGKLSFQSTEYGIWLARMWDIYMSDQSPVRIRILDDITKLVLAHRTGKGNDRVGEHGVVVIDTDGTIAMNDTLKNSFDGADRFPADWSVHTDDLFAIATSEVFERYCRIQRPTSPVCQKCPLLKVCGGGMPLYRWQTGNGYDNPSIYCNDHK